MPSATYIPMANITLGSSATSVTFSSISQAYRDLVLVQTLKSVSGSYQADIIFNNDNYPNTNYNLVYMFGDGASTGSGTSNNQNQLALDVFGAVGTTDGFNAITHIMDYSATDKHKSVLFRGNKSATGVEAVAGRWASTAAITSLRCSLSNTNGTFAAGSTFALYGIAS